MKIDAFFRCIILPLLMQWMPMSLLAQSVDHQPRAYEHTIVIKRWTLEAKNGDSLLLAEYDGKPIQKDTIATAFHLDSLKFELGSVVKIILPPGQMPVDNLLRDRLFLQHAIDDGANLEFYQGDKKLNYHTLLFRSLRMGPGSKEKGWRGGWNTDTATYMLDGRKFFDGPSTVDELKKLSVEDLVLIVIFPPGDDEIKSRFEESDKSEIDRYIEFLKENRVKFYAVGGAGYDAWPVPIWHLPK